MKTKEEWLLQKAKCITEGRCHVSLGLPEDACVTRETESVKSLGGTQVVPVIIFQHDCVAEECNG
jgi:hypothetical protein